MTIHDHSRCPDLPLDVKSTDLTEPQDNWGKSDRGSHYKTHYTHQHRGRTPLAAGADSAWAELIPPDNEYSPGRSASLRSPVGSDRTDADAGSFPGLEGFQTMLEEQQKFIALVEHSSDFIAMSSADGQVLYINPAGREMLGLDSLAEALSKDISEYFTTEEFQYFIEVILPTLSTVGRHESEGHLKHFKTGALIPVQRSCFTIRSSTTGAPICMATIQRDIRSFRATERALRESEERYRSLVELSPDGIAVHCNGRLTYVNGAAAHLLGAKASEDLLGQPIIHFLSPQSHHLGCDASGVMPEFIAIEGFVQETITRLDGTSLAVEMSGIATTHQGRPAFQLMIRDVSHRQQAENSLRAHARQQATVAKLGQRALEGIDLAVLFDEAAAWVAETLEVPYSTILELMPNSHAFLVTAGVGWQSGIVGCAMIGAQPSSQAGYTLRSATPVVFEDLRVDARFSSSQLLHNHRVISGMSVVIPGAGGQPFGVLGVYARHLRQFSEDDVHFLQAIANVLATAIDRKQADSRLHLMERVIAASSNGIVVTDPTQPDNPVIYVNPAFEGITGYSGEDVLGKNCRFLQGPDRDQAGVEELRRAIREQRECHVVLHNTRKDGVDFWNELFVAPVFDRQGYLTHFVGIQNDITERKRAEEALRQSEERLESILNSLEDIVWSVDAQTRQVLYLNPAAERIYGRPIAEFLQHPDLWLQIIHSDDRDRVLEAAALLRQVGSNDVEYRVVRPDGEIRWLRDRGHVVYDANGEPLRVDGISSDITTRKRMEEQLRHDALHDALTGLPNRALFMDRLRQSAAKDTRYPDHLFAVLFLDLDRFKMVNDSMGHLVGDQLLVAIARRLQKRLRPSDTLARLGGDEFTILLEDLKSPAEAQHVAGRIHRALRVPFNVCGHEIYINASIGIALSRDEAGERYHQPEHFLRNADAAMYHAKGLGKNRYEVFSPVMHTQAVRFMRIEMDLRRALERREFVVHYQPIVELQTGALTGFEALVRWHHAEHGWISPAEFIPVAEETGLIIPLGQWILEEACHQLKIWQSAFPKAHNLAMNVNLSVKQFSQPDLIAQIDRVLHSIQPAPGSLKLEITESAIMDNAEAAVLILQTLQAREVRFCIDDFGTGYSSLSQLHRFPAHTLKIDRSFVNRMDVRDEDAEIVRTIVTLAHNLRMDSVAEGIETPTQLHQLRSLGCELGQGYLLSRPLSAADAEALIGAWGQGNLPWQPFFSHDTSMVQSL